MVFGAIIWPVQNARAPEIKEFLMAETDKDDLISILDEDDAVADIPLTLPMMPVRDIVIFSDMLLPLFVGREKSILAVDDSVAKDGILFLATQKEPSIENPKPTTSIVSVPLVASCGCSSSLTVASKPLCRESPGQKSLNICVRNRISGSKWN